MMAKCKLIVGCPFFNDKMKNMPAISSIYKKNYCQEDNSNCARFIVYQALGSEKVPSDLFPNQQERAEIILESHGEKN